MARAFRQAESDVQQLLRDCEEVHTLLRPSISCEYFAMRQGESHLLGLLDRAEQIGKRALDLVNLHDTVA